MGWWAAGAITFCISLSLSQLVQHVDLTCWITGDSSGILSYTWPRNPQNFQASHHPCDHSFKLCICKTDVFSIFPIKYGLPRWTHTCFAKNVTVLQCSRLLTMRCTLCLESRTWGHLSYPSTWQCGWIPTSNIQMPGWHQGLAAFIILLMIFVSANLNQTLHKLVVQPMASWQWDWRSVMGWPRWIQPKETQDVSSGALVFPYFCGGRGGSPSSLKELLPPLSHQWQGRDVPPGNHAVGGER